MDAEVGLDTFGMQDSVPVFPCSCSQSCCHRLVEQFSSEVADGGEPGVSIVHFCSHVFDGCLEKFGGFSVFVCLEDLEEMLVEFLLFELGGCFSVFINDLDDAAKEDFVKCLILFDIFGVLLFRAGHGFVFGDGCCEAFDEVVDGGWRFVWGYLGFGWCNGCIGLAMSECSAEGDECFLLGFEYVCGDLMVELYK